MFTRIIKSRPFSWLKKHKLLTILSLLVVVIVVIFQLTSHTPDVQEETNDEIVKLVDVYDLSGKSNISTIGKVQDSNIVTIYAQSAGVIKNIRRNQGDAVYAGGQIAEIASTYSGSNASAIQSQIAYTTYKNAKENQDKQLAAVEDQRRLAELSYENGEDMREIANNSIGATESLISLNNDILDTLKDNLEALESNNSGGVNDDAILGLKQAISAQTGANLNIGAQLEQTKLSADEEGPQADLNERQKNMTIKQLELQEDAIKMNTELARLQSALANIALQATRPSSPIKGVIEKIFVVENQVVSPGTPIATISGGSKNGSISVDVPFTVAINLDSNSKVTISTEEKTYDSYDFSISSAPGNGTFYSVIINVQEDISLPTGTLVDVNLPLVESTNSNVLVPIDSLHQTQTENIVYIAEGDYVIAKFVKPGQVLGEFVEIDEGLEGNETIILSRNVVNGEKVKYN